MANYIVLASFTEKGIQGVKDTSKRAKGFRDAAKAMHCSIKDIYWTMGQHDVILTMEGPNDETVAALMLKVGALGNLKSQTLRAFHESEIDGILSKI